MVKYNIPESFLSFLALRLVLFVTAVPSCSSPVSVIRSRSVVSYHSLLSLPINIRCLQLEPFLFPLCNCDCSFCFSTTKFVSIHHLVRVAHAGNVKASGIKPCLEMEAGSWVG